VVVLAAALWGLGLSLAPDRMRFLASPEWHYQPFYLAAHLVTLQFFVLVYRANFNAGVANLESDSGRPAREIKRVLTPFAALLALAVAAPFCVFDYLYLYSDRYETVSADGKVRAVDLMMWGVWCAEWFLNALIWVVLLGFLIKNCLAIRRYRFRSPIEVVLHERHYRPFLRMSAQGATVLLVFSAVTGIYIWYTGGEITDYVGLMVTGGVLILGFVPPWLLLQAKVDRAVNREMTDLRRQLARDMQRARTPTSAENSARTTLEHRLEEVLGMLRITYLEQRHDKIGRTEAKAVLIRLLAPAATIAWQFRQHSTDLMASLGVMLQGLANYFTTFAGQG